MGCCEDTIEPCHTEDCGGLDEVVALLPHGRIWNPDRQGTYGQYIRALGHIKTELNKRICQEWLEMNPCTASRLLPFWADLYHFPTCVELTQENMCIWLALIFDQTCPIGSQGFIRRVIEFVAPTKGITISFNLDGCAERCWCGSKPCFSDNPIVISAPAAAFAWHTVVERPKPIVADGVNGCREYFIPEICCIRDTILPFGLGIGYKTDVVGPNGETIFGVPDTAEATYTCDDYMCNQNC